MVWAYKMRSAKRKFDCYFMVKIEDVTTQILEGTATLTSRQTEKIQENILD
jgi:hypothetical protein